MIRLQLPGLPLSINDAYMTIRKSKGKTSIPLRVLTPEGRKYKKEATAHLATHFPFELAKVKPNKPLVMYVRFYMENLENKSWPKTAESRYKRSDTTNRIKLLEDVIKDVTAVDDSNNVMTIQHKVQCQTATPSWTAIWIWDLEEEGCPFNDAALTI